MGFALDWQEMPDNKANHLVVAREGDFQDEARAQELAEWLIEHGDALTRVFRDRV